MGHLKNYSVGDAVAHFHRRTGRRVLHPMGYDAFGLPAENHAIKTGEHPRDSTAKSIAAVPARSSARWGISIDWSREFGTARAALLPLDAVDLPAAVRARAWPTARRPRSTGARTTQTVLANEQVIDGRCERCGDAGRGAPARAVVLPDHRLRRPPARRPRRRSSWPEHVVTMQRNWIGRSEGAEVTFRCRELGVDYPVFTTRPDTLFGATFFVMAPEHPDVAAPGRGHRARGGRARLRQPRADRGHEERGDADREKTGVPLGPHASSTRSTASGSRCGSPTTC